eukprot:g29.t1
MELFYSYQKVRQTFGHHCDFKDVEARILESIPTRDDLADDFVIQNPCVTELDTTPFYSQHEVNTDRIETHDEQMRHIEGGWPKDVDYTEQNDVQRFCKKQEKSDEFKSSVKMLGPILDRCMRQNNTIDIFEEYFDGDTTDYSSEPPSARSLAVFRDPNDTKRGISSVDWYPEGPSKIAVAYSILNFQDPRFKVKKMPVHSYIWEISNPNTPEQELLPPSPLVCMRFNPKSTDTLVGGCYNGLISYFDLRRSGAVPFETSRIETSHHDPVYDAFWISSKTGTQAASVSTDGQMLWWDTRKLSEPTDTIPLQTISSGQVLGGCSMEYNQEAGPTKYLVGTEQGIVLSINLRNRKQNGGVAEFTSGPGMHHGPIYSIQRNPTHSKFFMTIGDWTARIWNEDLKKPIMTTKYHNSYLISATWSPTRAGVFYVARMDGVIDIWDYFYRQNEVAYSHKVGESALSAVSVQGNAQSGGRFVAVGDINGTVSLLEVCESLAKSQGNEKQKVSAMFERESKREKNLEVREREIRKKMNQQKQEATAARTEKKDGKDEKMEEVLREVDANFLAMIKKAEAEAQAGEEEAGEGEEAA